MSKLVPTASIISKILFLRDEKVILDRDLAELYGVSTKALNQAVNRNKRRFPSDFMFRLTKKEKGELVTICDRFKTLKHSSVLPRAFTEQGVAMLSSVLTSKRAIELNIPNSRSDDIFCSAKPALRKAEPFSKGSAEQKVCGRPRASAVN